MRESRGRKRLSAKEREGCPVANRLRFCIVRRGLRLAHLLQLGNEGGVFRARKSLLRCPQQRHNVAYHQGGRIQPQPRKRLAAEDSVRARSDWLVDAISQDAP